MSYDVFTQKTSGPSVSYGVPVADKVLERHTYFSKPFTLHLYI